MQSKNGEIKRIVGEEYLSVAIRKLRGDEKGQMILSTLGDDVRTRMEQALGIKLDEEVIKQNLDKFDDTIVSALQLIKKTANKEKNEDLTASQAMAAYVIDVLNQKKLQGLSIQYDLDDLSKGGIRSIAGKIPGLKRFVKTISKEQKDYIYGMATKSTEFTEPAIGTYYKHSKILRPFFRDRGLKALPAPKPKDSKLGDYVMEDPDKYKADYEIDLENRRRISRNQNKKTATGERTNDDTSYIR